MPWSSFNLSDGTSVQLYLQQFDNECGPSCVATVGRIFGKGMDIGPARTAVGNIDHNKPPGGALWHDWTKDWSYMTSLTQALSQYGLRMAHTKKNQSAGNYQTFCEGRYLKSPAILRVRWTGGGGHFVVTVGKNKATRDYIEILDPAFGYQQVPVSGFPEYKPRDAHNTVLGTGEFDRFWSVETT